jgi:hypothetical protein
MIYYISVSAPATDTVSLCNPDDPHPDFRAYHIKEVVKFYVTHINASLKKRSDSCTLRKVMHNCT